MKVLEYSLPGFPRSVQYESNRWSHDPATLYLDGSLTVVLLSVFLQCYSWAMDCVAQHADKGEFRAPQIYLNFATDTSCVAPYR